MTDVYLYVVPIGGDPNHYIALENRYFLPRAQGGSYFNESSAGRSPESGLVIFEVNLRAPAGQYIDSASHIRRLLPSRVDPDLSYESGAFRPGDTLEYSVPGFSLTVGGIGDPGPDVTFTVEIVRQ